MLEFSKYWQIEQLALAQNLDYEIHVNVVVFGQVFVYVGIYSSEAS